MNVKTESTENINTKGLRYEDLPDFLTMEELRKYLRMGIHSVYALSKRPDFPKVPNGNRYIFPKKAVKEWMELQAEKFKVPKKLRTL